jgi:phosphoribosylanthranilate isomerase
MSKLSDKEREELPESDFAFPKERKEPIENASHVRDAVARFDQVEGVTNKERDEAWKRIKAAAKKFGVELHEQDWRELFKRNNRPIPKD